MQVQRSKSLHPDPDLLMPKGCSKKASTALLLQKGCRILSAYGTLPIQPRARSLLLLWQLPRKKSSLDAKNSQPISALSTPALLVSSRQVWLRACPTVLASMHGRFPKLLKAGLRALQQPGPHKGAGLRLGNAHEWKGQQVEGHRPQVRAQNAFGYDELLVPIQAASHLPYCCCWLQVYVVSGA